MTELSCGGGRTEGTVSVWHTGLAGDREEREELQVQPGCHIASAGGRCAVPSAERHSIRAHGENLPSDLQVSAATPKTQCPGCLQRTL